MRRVSTPDIMVYSKWNNILRKMLMYENKNAPSEIISPQCATQSQPPWLCDFNARHFSTCTCTYVWTLKYVFIRKKTWRKFLNWQLNVFSGNHSIVIITPDWQGPNSILHSKKKINCDKGWIKWNLWQCDNCNTKMENLNSR